MKRLAILTVAVAIGITLSPSSWKWGTKRARAEGAVVVMVTTADGRQFVASTEALELGTEPYTADVVTEDGTTYAGVTVDVLDAEEAESFGDPVTGLDVVDSWSW